MAFAPAFTLHRELGQTAAGELLPLAALTAIHWTHRLGAVVVALLAGPLALLLLRHGERRWRTWGGVLLGLLLGQIALGIANVLLALPLGLALLHNLGAAALLTTLLGLNIRLQNFRAMTRSTSRSAHPQEADDERENAGSGEHRGLSRAAPGRSGGARPLAARRLG